MVMAAEEQGDTGNNLDLVILRLCHALIVTFIVVLFLAAKCGELNTVETHRVFQTERLGHRSILRWPLSVDNTLFLKILCMSIADYASHWHMGRYMTKHSDTNMGRIRSAQISLHHLP